MMYLVFFVLGFGIGVFIVGTTLLALDVMAALVEMAGTVCK